MVFIPAFCTMSQTSLHSSLSTLSDLIPWIYFSLPLCNCKGFDLGHNVEWSSVFPYFLQFKSDYGNKEFSMWAIVSSQSCFCWLYRVSASLAAKNIINLISALTIWCVFPYFFRFKSDFGNKEFRIWAIVSSQSCFCWLYRASESLAAKNVINLISVLTIWWCPCVNLMLLKEDVCYDQCILLAKLC